MTRPSEAAESRAAIFLGAGKPFVFRDLPTPRPGPGEALVRIECCTICASDLHTISGARIEPTPTILGHEALGIVAELGDPPPTDVEGSPLALGDRITWSTAVSCGACDRCRDGLPQKCRSLAKYGHEIAEGRGALSGGLAERILLRHGSAIFRIDPQLPAEVVCPANCATATVVAALRTAGPMAMRRVLILGAGMLGLTATAWAKSLGAAVTVADIDPPRRQRALRFGAERVVGNIVDQTFDFVLEFSAAPEAVEAAIEVGDVGAKIVLVGSVRKSRPVRFDPERLVRRCLSVHGVHNYRPDDLAAALSFLARHGSTYPFAGLVEASYPLSEVNGAIGAALRQRPIRVALRP
jgi:putative phosphonate catabolism associated alcohol dehydrogenase